MSLKEQILLLGREDRFEDLSDLLNNQDCDEVAGIVKSSLTGSDGAASFVYVLSALGTSEHHQLLRYSVLKIILKLLIGKSNLDERTKKNVVEEIQTGVNSLEPNHLSDLIELCLSTLETGIGCEDEVGWLPVIASLLSAIGSKEVITPKNTITEVSGKEYRSRIISDICSMSWPPHLLSPMVTMFHQAKLKQDQVVEVFNKTIRAINRLPASELGPLVHHTIKLVEKDPGCASRLIRCLAACFNSHLNLADRDRANNDYDNQSVGMESVELIQSDHNAETIQQTECLVIYYIAQAAKMGHPIAKEVVKFARSSVNSPEVLMTPFSLFLCLAITCVKKHRTAILESLKQATGKCFSTMASQRMSAWFKGQTPAFPDMASLFSLVISQSVRYGGWDLAGEGLVELCFLYLDTLPPLGRMNSKVRSLHNLGSAILARTINKHPVSARAILSQLAASIFVNGKSSQYTNALAAIVGSCATILMESVHVVDPLVEIIHILTFEAGSRTLAALAPLARLSRGLRDALIIELRKSMFSKNVSSRQTAVSGIFTLMKTFKIKTSKNLSQLSQSSGSLSQLSMDIKQNRSHLNDSLCSELLGVLRRCFTLQPQVRMVMYKGLNEVVAKNPELCEGFLELVLFQASDLVSGWTDKAGDDDDSVHSGTVELELNRMVQEGKTEEEKWRIVEPAGWFLHCTQALVGRAHQILDPQDESDSLEKLTKLLDKLCDRYSQANLCDFGFDTSDNLDRKTAEGFKRHLQAEVLVTILEALMEYCMTHGADSNLDRANQLLGLFKNCLAMRKMLNAAAKPVKKAAAKKDKSKKEDDEPKDNGAGDKDKDTSKVRGRASAESSFVMPTHVLSFKCLAAFLPALLEDRAPEKQAALNKLRMEDDLLLHLSDLLAAQVDRYTEQLQHFGDEGARSDSVYRHLVSITSTLFRHTMTSSNPVELLLQPLGDNLLALLQILLIHFPRRRLNTLNCLTDRNPGAATESNLNPVLIPLMKVVMRKIAQLSDGVISDDEDASQTRLSTNIAIFSLLMDYLHQDESAQEPAEWVKKYSDKFESSNSVTVRLFVKLSFKCTEKLKPSSCLLSVRTARQLHTLYGDLDSSREVETTKDFPYLNPTTADIVTPVLMEHLELNFDLADQLTSWLKSVVTSLTEDSENVSLSTTNAPAIKNVEASLCQFFAHQVNACCELVNTAFPIGSTTDATLKLLSKLYQNAGNLGKYFFMRSKYSRSAVAAAKLDMLAKKLATNLTPFVYSLISYIEKMRKEEETEAKATKKPRAVDPSKAKAKVLRETKEIPALIFHIETYDKHMIKLGKRINQKLDFKLPTSRDFRIRFTEEQMRELQGSDESEDEDASGSSDQEGDDNDGRENASDNSDDRSSVSRVNESSMSDITNNSKREREEDEDEDEANTTKRSRLSAKLSRSRALKENRK